MVSHYKTIVYSADSVVLVSAIAVALVVLIGCPPEPSVPDTKQLTATPVDGPGFSLTILGGFEVYANQLDNPLNYFQQTYVNESTITMISVGVSKPVGSQSPMEGLSARIKGAMITQSGDFLLLLRLHVANPSLTLEEEAAWGVLANGDTLMVEVGSPQFTGSTEVVASNVFLTIDLKDTDGRDLERMIIEDSPTVRLKAEVGIVMLSDLSVWELLSSAPTIDALEVSSWERGDYVTSSSLSSDELIHVGNWNPVPFEYIGQARELAIVGADDSTLTISDGTTKRLIQPVPTTWTAGDTIFVVGDRMVIHEATGLAIRLT